MEEKLQHLEMLYKLHHPSDKDWEAATADLVALADHFFKLPEEYIVKAMEFRKAIKMPLATAIETILQNFNSMAKIKN